jgi:flagellar biosynthesis protein
MGKKVLQATALKYDRNESAPRVIAQGQGVVARKVIELAKKLDIPIEEDLVLSSFVGSIPAGKEIPPDLYEIIALLYKTLLQSGKWS